MMVYTTTPLWICLIYFLTIYCAADIKYGISQGERILSSNWKTCRLCYYKAGLCSWKLKTLFKLRFHKRVMRMRNALRVIRKNRTICKSSAMILVRVRMLAYPTKWFAPCSDSCVNFTVIGWGESRMWRQTWVFPQESGGKHKKPRT